MLAGLGRSLVSISLLVMILAMPARAAEPQRLDLDDRISPGSKTTYLDLARHFVPDLTASNSGYTGTATIAVRHLGGKDYEATSAEPSIAQVYRLDISEAGNPRAALLFDFGMADGAVQSVSILSLYDLAGPPKLLDAVDIGFDQTTSFAQPTLLKLSDGTDILTTESSHSNSNQTYVITGLVMPRNDQWQKIDTIFTFNDRYCGVEDTETLSFSHTSRRSKAPDTLSAQVAVRTALTGDDCGEENQTLPKPQNKTIKVTYRWNARDARYVPDSNAFEKLARENETRF